MGKEEGPGFHFAPGIIRAEFVFRGYPSASPTEAKPDRDFRKTYRREDRVVANIPSGKDKARKKGAQKGTS